MTRSRWYARCSLGGMCVLALVAAGCASAPVAQPIEAPRLVVGDRWHYRVIDNLRRGAVSELRAEVTAAAPGSVRIRVDYTDPFGGRSEWTDEVDGRGDLKFGALLHERPRPFSPPAQLIAFPLVDGKTWQQTIPTLRPDLEIQDYISIYGRVGGAAMTTVPAGTFRTVYLYRILRLDDEEFWRTRTTVNESVWYAPEVKAPVREEIEAEYTEKGGPDVATVRTESTRLELVSFQPGS